jgi:four helix bundle protein
MGKSYTDLDAWKLGRELVTDVYTITSMFPKEEIFGLTSQMRRSAVSIPSNIAEGIGRNHAKDTLQFLHIARGSSYELETQLYLSFDIKYLESQKLEQLQIKIVSCKKLLNGLINYYQSKL